jgi:hypothetical protein
MGDTLVNITEARDKIFEEIDEEQEYAIQCWGEKFDEKNTLNDWAAYITKYVGNAIDFSNVDNPEMQKIKLVKAANLAINAAAHIEAKKVAPRHYDNDKAY